MVGSPGETLPPGAGDVVCSPRPGPAALLMSFPELRQYSRLQISHDATIPYVLGAAILIVLGLLPALYVSRRKVWVRARADGPGSIVQVGGFALQRKDRFDEEFTSLVDAVVIAAGGAPTAEPAEVARP
jgi:cytochrome c biogenesis protein